MQQEDIDRIQEFRKCIECFLCQDVCHVIRDHRKETFAGPRFLIHLAGLDMHPLDTLDRRELVKDEFEIGLCNITKCCTEVCPENIHITDNGIIPLKERVADDLLRPGPLGREQDGGRADEGEGQAARASAGSAPDRRAEGPGSQAKRDRAIASEETWDGLRTETAAAREPRRRDREGRALPRSEPARRGREHLPRRARHRRGARQRRGSSWAWP